MLLSQDLNIKSALAQEVKDKKEIMNALDKLRSNLAKSLNNELDEATANYQFLFDINANVLGNEPCVSCDYMISYYAEKCYQIRKILREWV